MKYAMGMLVVCAAVLPAWAQSKAAPAQSGQATPVLPRATDRTGESADVFAPTLTFEGNEFPPGISLSDPVIVDLLWNKYGVRIEVAGGPGLKVASTGAPLESFAGFAGLPDRPFPGGELVTGSRFITFGPMTAAAPRIEITYRWPVDTARACFVDLAEPHESMRAMAYTVDPATGYRDFRAGMEWYPTGVLAPGVPLTGTFGFADAKINKVVITYIGSMSPGKQLTFGIDNIAVATRPQCQADFNADGGVDFGDYLEFFQALDAGALQADINGDLRIDAGDMLEFISLFDAGC